MELAVTDPFSQPAQPFADGFGERRTTVDARGQQLDVLRLDKTLSQVPSFESALRERVNRISSFRHESVSRVRTIDVDKSTGALLVVSDHVRGVRLSTLLTAAQKRSVPVDIPATTCMIRQLVSAVAAWHEQMPDIVHGAIGPDRIMITPDGRLILVESVFGSALEQLHYSRQRYWEELGVPLPTTFAHTINARADVLQVGAVAVALLLGRRLIASDKLEEIQPALADRLRPATCVWLSKALQFEPVGSFTSVLEARAALDQALGKPDLVEEQDSLLLFMARCLALNATPAFAGEHETDAASDTMPGSDDLPEVDLGTRIEALKIFLANRSLRASRAESVAIDQIPPPSDPSEEFSSEAEEPPPHTATATLQHEDTRPLGVIAASLPNDWTRRLWLAAAATLVIGIVVGVIAFGALPWSRGSSMGAFSIDTRPGGIPVTIDGTPRGVTPLTLDLPAGDHVVEVITETEHRKIPVTIRAGSDSSQFLEMGVAPSVTTSELRIRTEPLAAAVTVDGRYVGRSPVSVGDLTPGPHTVELKHEAGSATEQVIIEAGKTASLFVPLAAAPPPASAAGWISVTAPVDVQLFENGRFLGSSRIDRIMVPTGRHELDIVNDALGFQERRVVQVAAGQVAPIKLNWPTGRLSINAVPWALAFVDGAPVGETPIANMPVPIGPHEILLRHPQLGEHRASVTVTARETSKVGVDLRAK